MSSVAVSDGCLHKTSWIKIFYKKNKSILFPRFHRFPPAERICTGTGKYSNPTLSGRPVYISERSNQAPEIKSVMGSLED